MLHRLIPLLSALALLALAATPASAQSPSDVVDLVCGVAGGTPAPRLPVCPADTPGAPAPAPTEEEQDEAAQDAGQHQHGGDPQAQAQEVAGEAQTTVEKLSDNPTNPGPAIDLVTFLVQWVLDHVVTAPLDLLKGAGLGLVEGLTAGVAGIGAGISSAWGASVGGVASGADAVTVAIGSGIDGIASALEAAKAWVAELLAAPALPDVALGDAKLPVQAPEVGGGLLEVPDVGEVAEPLMG